MTKVIYTESQNFFVKEIPLKRIYIIKYFITFYKISDGFIVHRRISISIIIIFFKIIIFSFYIKTHTAFILFIPIYMSFNDISIGLYYLLLIIHTITLKTITLFISFGKSPTSFTFLLFFYNL